MNNLQETNQKESPDKTGKKQKKDTLFKKGVSGNPKGRPKGTLSLVNLLKKELEQIPKGQQLSYAQAIVKRLVQQAIKLDDRGMSDLGAIKEVINRVDGLPKQPIEDVTRDKIEKIKIEIVDGTKPQIN